MRVPGDRREAGPKRRPDAGTALRLAVALLVLAGGFLAPRPAPAMEPPPVAATLDSGPDTTNVGEHGGTASGAHGAAGAEVHGSELGRRLPLWSALPFLGILLSIAVFPLAAPHFWHRHFGKVSLFWASIFAIPFLTAFGGEALHEILHTFMVEYIPFIILLWALFTAGGGIAVRGTLRGTPAGNTLLLVVGTLIASWVGTTGASMLMIRPVLRANAHRRRKVHVVCFFIFLVSNIGGSLTPLGDPPLFLGFLHHVPFFWTLHLIPHMFLVSVVLLVIFFLLDRYHYRREEPEVLGVIPPGEPFRLAGAHNLLFLLGVMAFVLVSGLWNPGDVVLLGVRQPISSLIRDLGLVAMGLLSIWTTSKTVRKMNEFSWFPIKEVAILFAGIFMTIIPALALLRAGPEGPLGGLLRLVNAPSTYFWFTGVLSSFLDNAPTYLTFFNSALASLYPGLPEPRAVADLISNHEAYLAAISAGAVFMGANTYIGNAPNFMVKSIAEEAGIPMPSFFGYMLRYSIPVLIPLFVVVSLIWF
jgi:Na+/H+ antiporter NhaD/arsenite permease-like protein